MNFQFPIRRLDGKSYIADDLLDMLAQETTGHYLLGSNDFWHGGIHFTDQTLSDYVFNEPVRCIADGKVIAYRINGNYCPDPDQTDEDKALKYSTSFCLVKHEYNSPSAKESTTVTNQNKNSLVGQYIVLNEAVLGRHPLGDTFTFPVGARLKILSINPDNDGYISVEPLKGTYVDEDGTREFFLNYTGNLFIKLIDAEGNLETDNTNPNDPKPLLAKFNKFTFYSLYMHLLPATKYGDNLLRVTKVFNGRKEDINGGIDASNTGLIKNIPEGTIFEILDDTTCPTNGNYTYTKVKIIYPTGRKVDNEDIFWIANRETSTGQPYKSAGVVVTEKIKFQYPHYWNGKVTRKVTDKDGFYATPLGTANRLELAKDEEFTYIKSASIIEDQSYPPMICTRVSTGELFHTTLNDKTSILVNIEPENYCDQVINCNIDIKAGDPLGYLGLCEIEGQNNTTISKYQVHIEIFSKEKTELEDFLANKAGVQLGKKYIYINQGAVLTHCREIQLNTATIPVVIPQAPINYNDNATETYVLQRDHAIEKDKIIKINNNTTGDSWYEVTIIENMRKYTGRISTQDTNVSDANQNDWAKLGYTIITEKYANRHGYVLGEVVDQLSQNDAYIDEQKIKNISPFFRSLYNEIDALGTQDNKVSQEELRQALADGDLRERWAKIIAYHPTEWQGNSSAEKWRSLVKDSYEFSDFEKQRLDDTIFWDEVTELVDKNQVFHFHPIVFIEDINRNLGTYHIYSTPNTTATIGGKGYIAAENCTDDTRFYKYIYYDTDANGTITGYEVFDEPLEVFKMREKVNGKKFANFTANYSPSTNLPSRPVVWYNGANMSIDGIEAAIVQYIVYNNDTKHIVLNHPDRAVWIRERVYCKNDDIIEHGFKSTYENTKYSRIYRATTNISYVPMLEIPSLNNKVIGTKTLSYNFEGTERKYTDPAVLAGFIGLLAEIGFEVTCSGSSFKDCSCFPSLTHVNGKSIDTHYLNNNVQDRNVIRAGVKFHFTVFYVGTSNYLRAISTGLNAEFTNNNIRGVTLRVDEAQGHDSHLHFGSINEKKFITLAEFKGVIGQ